MSGLRSAKHFINDVRNPVQVSLTAAARGADGLRVLSKEQADHGKVIPLSGGGSGHETAHTGYVGEGMLDVVVAGNIFASPSASQILAGVKSVDACQGILMNVKNYTGDKLNFGLAATKARALGLNVKVVMVGDGVSVANNPTVGRRGLAGVVFIHKVAGALAAKGADLSSVATIANKTVNQMATVADESLITEYDTLARDGDCGETLLDGVNGLVELFDNLQTDSIDLAHMFRQIAIVAETWSSQLRLSASTTSATRLTSIFAYSTSSSSFLSSTSSIRRPENLSLEDIDTLFTGEKILLHARPGVGMTNESKYGYETVYDKAKNTVQLEKV